MLLFRQFVDEGLGCASYLVGDAEAGVAVVVDPSFHIEPYLLAAGEESVRIERVLETHTHADHVSGHGRFALEHGVPVAINPIAEAEYPSEPLTDGQQLEVGEARVRVIHTPGHRPEHCAFLVDEHLLLSGDSLFVGDAARPDLAVPAREGAEDLFHSLAKLRGLRDGVEIYPGHVAGSLCGGNMSPERSSTLSHECATNPMLDYRDIQDFVMASASISSPRPPTTEHVVALNRGPWVPLPDEPRELPDAGGATILDVRPLAAHAEGHLPGAINIPVSGGSFGTRAGFVIALDEPVALHARSSEEALEATRQLWAVGLFAIAGYLLTEATPETLPTIDAQELKRMLRTGEIQLLDVRESDERDASYIPGSRNIPYRLLRKVGSDALERDRPVVTICESGARAGIAASLLQREGFDVRAVADGGIPDFDGETVSFRRCGA